MRIVVVSPHRDDAAFSLSLTVQSWIDEGHSVAILNCFTRSDFAPFSDAASLHANDRHSYVTALRSREDEAWRRHYGSRLSLHDLNLKDAPLRLRCSIDEVCNRPVDPNDKALLKISKALDSMKADAWVMPLGLGGHVDHATARMAAWTERVADSACAFYEDLPYASRPGAAATIATAASNVSADLKPLFATEPSLALQQTVALKRKLVLCYDSQIDDDVTNDIAEFCTRYEGRERLWVNHAWRSSPSLASCGSDEVEAR